MKTYTELSRLKTFEERFRYLALNGRVSSETFGSNRYANQAFYKSREWRDFRNEIAMRDNWCDLGIPGREIRGQKAIVHHLNPISFDDIINRNLSVLLDPDNAILTIHNTHQAIHYSDESILLLDPIERRPGDTCPWR